MKTLAISLLSILLTMSTGCERHPEYISKYGVAYNVERQKRGIPVIPPTWTIRDMGDYFECFDPKPDRTKPHRLLKQVFMGQNGLITRETDSFYSGKTFYWPSDQVTLPQRIIIEYSYSTANAESPWKTNATLGVDQFSIEITIQEGDRLLASWGLSR